MWGAPIEALTITLPANDEVSNAALAELPVKVIAVDNTLLIVSVTEPSILFLIVGKTIVFWTGFQAENQRRRQGRREAPLCFTRPDGELAQDLGACRKRDGAGGYPTLTIRPAWRLPF